MAFICSCCGKEHDEWPAFTFDSSTSYHELTEEKSSWQKSVYIYKYLQAIRHTKTKSS